MKQPYLPRWPPAYPTYCPLVLDIHPDHSWNAVRCDDTAGEVGHRNGCKGQYPPHRGYPVRKRHRSSGHLLRHVATAGARNPTLFCSCRGSTAIRALLPTFLGTLTKFPQTFLLSLYLSCLIDWTNVTHLVTSRLLSRFVNYTPILFTFQPIVIDAL